MKKTKKRKKHTVKRSRKSNKLSVQHEDKEAHRKITSLFFGVFLIAFVIVVILLVETRTPVIEDVFLSDNDLHDLAVSKNDVSYCNKIQDPIQKRGCENLFPDSQKDEDDLIKDRAVEQNDQEICYQINNPIKQKGCLNLFTIQHQDPDELAKQKAIEENDVSYCYQIELEIKRRGCLNLFA